MRRQTLANKCIFMGCTFFLSAIAIGQLNLRQNSELRLNSFLTVFLCLVLLLLSLVAWHIASLRPADSHSLKSLLFQYFAQLVFLCLGSLAKKRLVVSSGRLVSTQENLLKQILARNCKTRYGRIHEFKDITSRKDFAIRVPLTIYSDYEEYIQEIFNCKDTNDVLTSDPIVFLAISSGTTGRNKNVPLTSFTKRVAARAIGPLMFYCQSSIDGVSLQRMVLLGYRAHTSRSPSQLEVGPVSSHIGRYPPYAVAPREVYDIDDEQVALHFHSIFALAERNVGRMEALLSTLMYSFWRYVETYWRLICDEIETGNLNLYLMGGEYNAREELSGILRKYFRPDPVRACQLRDEFGRGFVGIARRIWPDIRSVRMVTSGGFAHHARLLRRIHMRGVKQISPIHAASEGFFGINISDRCDLFEPQYTLLPDYGFFEFIEETKVGEERPDTIFTDQVLLNRSYEIVYTSQTGLYRYRTGDVVKIVGYFNECPVYTFAYRLGQMLNLYWEKTPEAVFYSALCRVIDSVEGLVLLEYTATEDIFVPALTDLNRTTKHYVLFIEAELDGLEVKLSDELKDKFDESLCLEFDLYSDLRRSHSISAMQVYQVHRGAFSRVKSNLLRGAGSKTLHSPQYKMPRVVRDPTFLQLLVKEILA